MSFDEILTLLVIVGVLGVLVAERVSPALTILGGLVVLLVAGVVDAGEAFSGFSNSAPLTVAALYVLAAAVGRTRVLEAVVARLPSRASGPRERGERGTLARVVVPAAGASAVLNNTPIVAMAIPPVLSWCRRTGRSPSRFLMPVSFAAVAGGTITLIGTSTNLVVSGLMEDAGQEPMGLFEIGAVGLPLAILSIIVMIAVTPLLLPDRRSPSESVDADAREFTVEMEVKADGGIAGRSVAEGGLRSLQGVYLVEVERPDGHRISSVRPDEVLSAGDRLTFAGNVTRILDLQDMRGLASVEERHFGAVGSSLERRLYEAVVAPGSGLVGSTLRETGFRGRYGGAVIAIHRADDRIQGKLGEVRLRPGDVLLVLAGPAFRPRALDRRDFLLIAPLGGDGPPREEKAPIVGLLVLALLVLVGTGVLDILTAALLAAFAVVGLRVLTPGEARDAVDLDVIVVIAASFGLGQAIEQSGLADTLADTLIEPFGGFGDIGLLAGVLLATIVVTEMISNNAAAALLFPVAVATAASAGLDPRPFAFAVAIGASSSFITPIGYQTNTMVYGIGGYRFLDFARLGFPLVIVMMIVALVMIPIAWPLR